jgi:hypothetical protein
MIATFWSYHTEMTTKYALSLRDAVNVQPLHSFDVILVKYSAEIIGVSA